jgi:hypothetical protein
LAENIKKFYTPVLVRECFDELSIPHTQETLENITNSFPSMTILRETHQPEKFKEISKSFIIGFLLPGLHTICCRIALISQNQALFELHIACVMIFNNNRKKIALQKH